MGQDLFLVAFNSFFLVTFSLCIHQNIPTTKQKLSSSVSKDKVSSHNPLGALESLPEVINRSFCHTNRLRSRSYLKESFFNHCSAIPVFFRPNKYPVSASGGHKRFNKLRGNL